MTDDEPREWWCPHCRQWVGPAQVTPEGRHTCGTPAQTAEDRMRLAGLGLLGEAEEEGKA